MRMLLMLLLTSLASAVFACTGNEPNPTPTPTPPLNPTQTPDIPATVEAGILATTEAEASIDATVTARVEAARASEPTPIPTPTAAPTPTPTPTPPVAQTDGEIEAMASRLYDCIQGNEEFRQLFEQGAVFVVAAEGLTQEGAADLN